MRTTQLRSIFGGLLLAAATTGQPALAVAIDSGFTGAWYDPAQSGHGLFVEVLNNNSFLAWWFTFNPAGTQQSWFGGVGTYSGNTATISSVIQTTGGRWIPNFDPSKLTQIPWGTLSFTFTDCNNGWVDFNSTVPGYAVGRMTLSRLTLPAGLTCTQSAGGNPDGAEGMWTGTTSADQAARVLVLDDGTYYVLYSLTGSGSDGGIVQGTLNGANGQIATSDGIDFPIATASETSQSPVPASVSGSYTARSSLQLMIGEDKGSRTVSTTYNAWYAQPASLDAVAGTYTAITGHANGKVDTTVVLDSSGTIAGINDGCVFKGTLAPHKLVNVFDFTLSATNGTTCIWGRGPQSGVLYYDPATRQIHGLSPFSGRQDLWYIIGTK